MNDIAIGIMCFGDEEYFLDTKRKLIEIINFGIPCFILTDNPKYFSDFGVNIILHDRKIKSYHDKIILVKRILDKHSICVLIDADLKILDNEYLKIISNYNFENGITYIDTLLNHSAKKQFIKDIQMNPENVDWYHYRKYIEKIYPEYNNLETIYEYFIVFNRDTINDNFFKTYEKLQCVKESCDILSYDKKNIGAGEGISLHISAKVSNCEIRRDTNLFELLNKKIKNINKSR